MLTEKTVRGTNFTCVHAGPMDGWGQFRMEPPEVPMPTARRLWGASGPLPSVEADQDRRRRPAVQARDVMTRDVVAAAADNTTVES